MKFIETTLEDAVTVELEESVDERGFFARRYCYNEFFDQGIIFQPVQTNVSYNRHKYTLRGMHYQEEPHAEAKLVYCTRGAIFDVIIDMRPESKTYLKWEDFILTEVNHRMLYIPKGFAHGFLTLEEKTEVGYMMSEFYKPGFGRGIRWDDPAFNIAWPENVAVMSEKDKKWPLFVAYHSE